jgi:hypothetical protein
LTAIPSLKCGCEVREGRLLTVCAMHANYTKQHVEKARAPREGVDKDLQRQLVVAITPIVVTKLGETTTYAGIAERIHEQVHEIMRRMD